MPGTQVAASGWLLVTYTSHADEVKRESLSPNQAFLRINSASPLKWLQAWMRLHSNNGNNLLVQLFKFHDTGLVPISSADSLWDSLTTPFTYGNMHGLPKHYKTPGRHKGQWDSCNSQDCSLNKNVQCAHLIIIKSVPRINASKRCTRITWSQV